MQVTKKPLSVFNRSLIASQDLLELRFGNFELRAPQIELLLGDGARIEVIRVDLYVDVGKARFKAKIK